MRATEVPNLELELRFMIGFWAPLVVESVSVRERAHQDEVSGEEELPVTEQLEVKEFVPSRR